MPTHIHFVLGLRGGRRSLSEVVAQIKRDLVYHSRHRGVDVKLQLGFYDRIIREYEKSDEFAKYVLLNPVRAGLVKTFDTYPFSGRCDSWR